MCYTSEMTIIHMIGRIKTRAIFYESVFHGNFLFDPVDGTI